MVSLAEYWEQQSIQRGIQQGVQVGEMKLITIAKKMLEKNKSMDEIIEFTDLNK